MGKWPFFDQNHGLSPLEKAQFFDFSTVCFYRLDRHFFVLEYRKKHCLGLYCLKKKKTEKWQFLDQNHGLTRLEKSQFFDFFNYLFLQDRQAFFSLEYRKKHFLGLYCLPKKDRKMAIFGPKPWVNPFEKISVFGIFELHVFIGQKRVFSFQNIVKHIFLGYISYKKNMEKWPFFDQNHGLSPLEKSQFLDFLNFLLLQA